MTDLERAAVDRYRAALQEISEFENSDEAHFGLLTRAILIAQEALKDGKDD